MNISIGIDLQWVEIHSFTLRIINLNIFRYSSHELRNHILAFFVVVLNRFIFECARKKKAKIPEYLSYRRTYLLNKLISDAVTQILLLLLCFKEFNWR